MEIDHLLQDLNGFGASLEFNVADTDIPQIVEPSAISNSLCVQQQDKDEERRKEALAIQEQIKEKERALWLNWNMQNRIQEQLEHIHILLGKHVLEPDESEKKPAEPNDSPQNYSLRVLRSFPIRSNTHYFSQKLKSYPRFLSPEGTPLTYQSTKRSISTKQWSEKSESKLRDLVLEECKQLIALGSVPPEQSSTLQKYRSASTPEEKTHFFHLLIPSLLNTFSWETIACKVDHSQTDCFVRWMNCCDPFINQATWTVDEDRRLLEASRVSRKRNWVQVAAEVGNGRVPFQCFQRFVCELEMQGAYRKWTPEEDEQLRRAVQELGTKAWKAVAKRLSGRSWDQCRSRYYQSLQLTAKKGHWSEMEKLRLLLYLYFYGEENWGRIAQKMVTRNAVQCRDEWNRCLKPTISHKKWSAKEDKMLLSLVNKMTAVSWTQICRKLPGRTADACKTRYRFLTRHQ